MISMLLAIKYMLFRILDVSNTNRFDSNDLDPLDYLFYDPYFKGLLYFTLFAAIVFFIVFGVVKLVQISKTTKEIKAKQEELEKEIEKISKE